MFAFINDHLGIIVSASIVLSTPMAGAYVFGQYVQDTYHRWGYWVMKLVGFLTALVVLPATPYILYVGISGWNDKANADGVYVLLLTWTVMAAIASAVHIIGFPVSTYRMFRPQQT